MSAHPRTKNKRTGSAALREVLVPTDFSSGAMRAAERAALLPLHPKGCVRIVHVLRSGTPKAGQAHVDAERLLEKALARIRTAAHAARKPEPRVLAHILEGEPHVEIIRFARTMDIELVVLGRKGEGRGIKKTLGTTASNVVRMGETPVLVAGAPARRPYRRPMVAVETDTSARRVIKLAAGLCAPYVKRMSVVHAFHAPFEGFVTPGASRSASVYRQQIEKQQREALNELVRSLKVGMELKPVLKSGDARSVILTEATRQRADLIALGTHGRSGVAHVLLGSVAEWIVANALQDVLIARPVRFTFAPP